VRDLDSVLIVLVGLCVDSDRLGSALIVVDLGFAFIVIGWALR
jgi:hypothetical protein